MTMRMVRSDSDRVIGGVCGGLGRYLNIDPVIVRLSFVLFTLAGGAGILVYLILLILMPTESSEIIRTHPNTTTPADQRGRTQLLVGGVLILVGAWTLLGQIPGLAWISLGNLWPLLVVIAGALMIATYFREGEG